jgi:hypothetical protein
MKIKLARSLTAADDGSRIINPARISETCWLYDEYNQYMKKLSEYVSDVIKVNMTIAEPWQV